MPMSNHYSQRDFDNFLAAYITAALWSSTTEDGTPLDRDHTVDMITGGTMAEMILDCAKFVDQYRRMVEPAIPNGYSWAQAGYDFWLTRNGHGAGFWDREVLEAGNIGEALTKAAKTFGECNLFANDGEVMAY